jgi:large subunit ribosomal protein L23
MKINSVLLEPVMTEKASKFATGNVYMFHVAEGANKNQVKNTIEDIFKVKVSKVTVSIRKGKMHRVGRRMTPKALPDRKIAYVTLKEGKIDLFPSA